VADPREETGDDLKRGALPDEPAPLTSAPVMSPPDPEARELRYERRLYAFMRRLARERDPQRVHALILRTLAAQVAARTGAIATYRHQEDALAITATVGYPASIVEHLRISPGEGIFGQVFASGRPRLGNAAVERNGSPRLRYHTDSYLAVPLNAGGKRLGVVALTDRAGDADFTPHDLAVLRLFSTTAALALHREEVVAEVAELRRMATVDAVTGLFNRRYFETRLEAEVQRASRQHQELAVLMLDIDDFKRINDTWGHIEGDRVLRDVAELLRTRIRVFDVCARFGGEEFVIVMPGAGHQIAVRVAERIRRELKARTSAAGVKMTISVGVGLLGRLTTPTALLESADRALIAAKSAGKDAVWIDDPEGSPRQTS
jgi:diguanylate cyclase (GGDEF)-like protein